MGLALTPENERCASLQLESYYGGIVARPCPYVTVRTVTIACEDGIHVTKKRTCMKCAELLIRAAGTCPACLLEKGRPSRLSALETE
jgi:hypothetical protein